MPALQTIIKVDVFHSVGKIEFLFDSLGFVFMILAPKFEGTQKGTRVEHKKVHIF